MWSIRSTHIIKKLQYLEYLSAVVEWMYFATFLHCLWSTFPRSLNHSVTPQASALTMFLHSFIHASPHSSESKLPTLNSPLPPLTSLIVSLHHTPSGPQLKRRWRAVERGVGGWGFGGGAAGGKHSALCQPSASPWTLEPPALMLSAHINSHTEWCHYFAPETLLTQRI